MANLLGLGSAVPRPLGVAGIALGIGLALLHLGQYPDLEDVSLNQRAPWSETRRLRTLFRGHVGPLGSLEALGSEPIAEGQPLIGCQCSNARSTFDLIFIIDTHLGGFASRYER
jgi:hypothetical protein